MKCIFSLLLFYLLVFQVCQLGAEPLARVGVISGLSGAAAKWNHYQNLGIRLAQEEYLQNEVEIELVFEDSATLAPKVITAYNKLFKLDQVDAVIANDFGFVIAPLLPLVKQQRRLLFTTSLPHKKYCIQADGYLFTGTSQFSRTKAAFEKFFDLNPRVQKIALFVHDDPEWGNTYRDIWISIAKQRDIEVVEIFESADFTPDFKTPFARVVKKEPDAIFLAHEPESFVKTVNQFDYDGLIVSANHILEMLADNYDRIKGLEGIYFVDPIISEEFREKFFRRFKKQPILEAYAGYESLRSLIKAFQTNPNSPAQGMRSVNYQGVAGQLDYTGDSCAGNFASWGLYRFQDGKPVLQ